MVKTKNTAITKKLRDNGKRGIAVMLLIQFISIMLLYNISYRLAYIGIFATINQCFFTSIQFIINRIQQKGAA